MLSSILDETNNATSIFLFYASNDISHHNYHFIFHEFRYRYIQVPDRALLVPMEKQPFAKVTVDHLFFGKIPWMPHIVTT